MRKITVTVTGIPGAGKSTIIQMIERELADYGFTTKIISMGDHPERDEDSLMTAMDSIRSKVEIEIVETHLPRGPGVPINSLD